MKISRRHKRLKAKARSQSHSQISMTRQPIFSKRCRSPAWWRALLLSCGRDSVGWIASDYPHNNGDTHGTSSHKMYRRYWSPFRPAVDQQSLFPDQQGLFSSIERMMNDNPGMSVLLPTQLVLALNFHHNCIAGNNLRERKRPMSFHQLRVYFQSE